MKQPEKAVIRRYRRFVDWDYGGKGASLFITIATSARRPLFGRVVGGRVELSPLGRIVLKSLEEMPARNPSVTLHGHVVMPDHVHFNVHLAKGQPEPLKALGEAIRRFKVFTTKQAKLMGILAGHSPALQIGAGVANGGDFGPALQIGAGVANGGGFGPALQIGAGVANGGDFGPALQIGAGVASEIDGAAGNPDGRAPSGPLWQQGYHDRLCLCRAFIEATERYIAYNPMKWELMYGANRLARIIEPLEAPCLDPNDYWKGVGNAALLAERLVALRVSREVRDPRQLSTMLTRLSNAITKGYVILSGFVSPGEKLVRDMLCENKAARFVRILPTCLPNVRYKPESRYVAPLAEGRYLEIARGNDDVGFDRTACLDYNREIIEMAHASSGGLAVYWKADGPHWL